MGRLSGGGVVPAVRGGPSVAAGSGDGPPAGARTPDAGGRERRAGYLYAGPLSLEYTLPEQAEGPRSILEIRQLYAAAELRLDGAPFQNIPAGSGNLYVTLPPDWSGKALTLIMEKGAEDPEPSLYLTSSAVINELARADTSLRAFPAAAFGMIFLLALGLFLLYGTLEGSWSWPVLLLSIAALGQAAYFYLQNSSLFSLPPALYGLVLCQSRALLFAAPPLYLMLGMKKWRKAFAPFAVLPSLFYFVVAGFQTVVPLFSGIAVHAGLAFCFTIAALLACAALEVRDGNPVFRRFLPWLGGCAAAILLLSILPAARTGPHASILWAFLAGPILWIDTELFYWNSLLLALCLMGLAAGGLILEQSATGAVLFRKCGGPDPPRGPAGDGNAGAVRP